MNLARYLPIFTSTLGHQASSPHQIGQVSIFKIYYKIIKQSSVTKKYTFGFTF